MSLTEALLAAIRNASIWGCSQYPGLGNGDRKGSELIPQGSGRTALFAFSGSFSARRTV